VIPELKHISFSQPSWLFLLLLLPAAIILYVKYIRNTFPVMFVNVMPSRTKSFLSPADYLFLLRIICIGFIIVGLANPRFSNSQKIANKSAESDIVFALDASKSMMIEDIKPNRMEALKDVLSQFVAMRSGGRIGMVLYAGESILWCPLTKNQPQILSSINAMSNNNLTDGTAIGSGLVSAIKMLEKSTKTKVIILLTDGENNAGMIDPLLAAKLAKHLKIKVYCVGIGKKGFADIPLKGLDGKKYYQKIKVSINESVLKKIATTTGGAYFNATDEKALLNIYTIINKLEIGKVNYSTKVSYTSCFRWLVYGALIILLIELLLKFTILKNWPS
jgi:Ca-activated chloride channel family protein